MAETSVSTNTSILSGLGERDFPDLDFSRGCEKQRLYLWHGQSLPPVASFTKRINEKGDNHFSKQLSPERSN